jgi:hypothetical protein
MTTQTYYVLRDDTGRCIGRAYGADEETALADARGKHARIAREVGVRVELASAPPARLAKQLARMKPRQYDRAAARQNAWQKQRDAQFDLSSSSE